MYDLLPRRIKVLIFVEMPSSVRCQFLYGKDMGGIDFAACRRKIEANSTLVRTVIRGLQKKGYKKTPQENSYGVWDRKKALILSYQCLFFRRYLILNLTPRSLPPKNIVLPTNSMFSYPEAGKGTLYFYILEKPSLRTSPQTGNACGAIRSPQCCDFNKIQAESKAPLCKGSCQRS